MEAAAVVEEETSAEVKELLVLLATATCHSPSQS
jgi:hypothetical protein